MPNTDPQSDPLQTWKQHDGWRNHLALNILGLVEPGSIEAQQWPHLHEVFADRLDQSMSAREGDPVSKCDDEFPVLAVPDTFRADSHEFQHHVNNVDTDEYDGPINDTKYRMNHMCRLLCNRMYPYAEIGSGTYGSVFVARAQHPTNPTRNKYYAVKVETHWTMQNRMQGGLNPSMTVIEDEDGYRYIPYEAFLLLLVSNSDRFPTLESVYVDDVLHSTVMSVCLDHDLLMLDPSQIKNKRVVAFTGRFVHYKKRPILNELEACKIASQLLEGYAYLRDMNLSHGDLSKNNYIIDGNLNAQLIDLGMTSFAFNASGFIKSYWAHIDALEHVIAPELAIELSKPFWRVLDGFNDQVDVYLPHNALNEHMWRFAALTYDILHGFAPWESPDPYDQHVDKPRRNEDEWDIVYDRRHRLINEELPINENLSQDCADALRMMLMKNPMDRPTLGELCSFPWFDQWAYHTDTLFIRPYSESYRRYKLEKGVPI